MVSGAARKPLEPHYIRSRIKRTGGKTAGAAKKPPERRLQARLPAPQRLLIERAYSDGRPGDYNVHAAVLLASGGRVVGGYRVGFAESDGGD